ncbi:MAG: hypothetical protein HC925_04000 [Coleofasciculaceae cyanobacterium SM2_3_26]|nr:hypothetical protein [Coleofasciculaceae cyanobacterium SM2_3_26]
MRVIVGIKKQNQDHPTEKLGDWFDSGRMLLSLLIGAIAGTLSATILLGTEINRQFLLTIIAAGYAGTDFIEGFLKSQNLPQNLPQDIPRMALQAEEPEE